MSAICLVAAGLLLHSFVKIMRVDPGFTSERVVTVDVALPGVRYPAPKRVEFYRTLLSEVSALPGVSVRGDHEQIAGGRTGNGGNCAHPY